MVVKEILCTSHLSPNHIRIEDSMTKIATLLLSVFLLAFVSLSAQAQSPTPNIALSATCTHSGGGTTTYAPTNYNDGVIAAAGSTPWGWTSGGTHTGGTYWIMFEWAAPVTFGEITLYYGGISNRYLAGSDIQIWTGSAWVTVYTWSTTVYTDYLRVLQFAPQTTTKMRITNWVMAPVGQTSNPNFREIEIRNICTDPATQVSFTTDAFAEKPNPLNINYTISRPYGTFNVAMTIKLFTPTGTLVKTENTNVAFNGGTVTGTYQVSTASLPVGYYRVEVTFNVMDICNAMVDVKVNQQTMVVNPNTVPCVVWPGDVNNDGVVNYGDRKSLNKYIFDANLRQDWLVGPARYNANASTNPLTYLIWEAQAGIPWNTPDGCYMDADGNGFINNFDYVGIKLNWIRSHGTPKAAPVEDFDLLQAYPNPFNPSTTIRFAISEKSDVTLEVMNMSGKVVAVLCREVRNAGDHRITFDASELPTGTYMVTLTAAGQESGMVFSKNIKISMVK